MGKAKIKGKAKEDTVKVSKTAKASLANKQPKQTTYPVLVVESYTKENGAIGLRRLVEWRDK